MAGDAAAGDGHAVFDDTLVCDFGGVSARPKCYHRFCLARTPGNSPREQYGFYRCVRCGVVDTYRERGSLWERAAAYSNWCSDVVYQGRSVWWVACHMSKREFLRRCYPRV